MDRREAHACGLLLSSLPFSTIAYQRVCWGASYIIIALEPTASSFGSAVLRLRFRRRLTAGVGLQSILRRKTSGPCTLIGKCVISGDNAKLARRFLCASQSLVRAVSAAILVHGLPRRASMSSSLRAANILQPYVHVACDWRVIWGTSLCIPPTPAMLPRRSGGSMWYSWVSKRGRSLSVRTPCAPCSVQRRAWCHSKMG